MVDSLREYYLPAISITILLGYQLTIYFLYQFFKNKDKKLELTKILEAIGAFLGFSITVLAVRTNFLYFSSEHQLTEIFNKLSIFLSVMGFLTYLIIISADSFKDILNQPLTRILIISNLITVCALFFFNTSDKIFILFMLPLLASLIYVIFVQFNLISLTTGNIRKHLIIILIGIIVFTTGLIIGRNSIFVLIENLEIYYVIISPLLLIIGLGMIFLGIYRIPAFLEFGWKSHLNKFFITTKEDFKILYSYDFQIDRSSSQYKDSNFIIENSKDKTISRAVFGIDEIFSSITNIHDDKLSKIKHGGYYIIIEYGKSSHLNLTYVLVVNEDLSSFQFIIHKLKELFEESYQFILNNIIKIEEKEQDIFSSFDTVIKEFLN